MQKQMKQLVEIHSSVTITLFYGTLSKELKRIKKWKIKTAKKN